MDNTTREWLDARLLHLKGRPLAQARLLLCIPNLPLAWKLTRKLGSEVEQLYWAEFLPYGRGPNFVLINDAARQLLEHNRPLTALRGLSIYITVNEQREMLPSPELIAQGLEALIRLPTNHTEQVGALSAYDIRHLLDYLADSGLDEDRLAVLEWQLLPARGFADRSGVLDRRLSRDPAFFVDVLSLSFKRKDGTMEQEVSDDVASNAYRLLSEWHVVPGLNDTGQIDQDNLMQWITEVQLLAAERDRAIIGDLYIGHVLAYSPADPDGLWPAVSVRNVIEELASSDIERGLYTEIFSKRGVTSRSLAEGGRQERELAERYDKWAAELTDQWRRTARILRSVAEGYRAEARREDEEAERFRRGIDR